MDRRLLDIYLTDHLAGATGVLHRLDRMVQSYPDLPIHEDIVDLHRQVRAERARLARLISDLDLPHRRQQLALARVGEVAGRLKLNGRVSSRSPLTPLVELEALRAGVAGKLSLWQTLQAVAGELGLDAAELETLEQQAKEQFEVIERCHQMMAPSAFDAQR